eukprot:scaffold454296_cov15-Prasinocladus_malaysianus.AAC.1
MVWVSIRHMARLSQGLPSTATIHMHTCTATIQASIHYRTYGSDTPTSVEWFAARVLVLVLIRKVANSTRTRAPQKSAPYTVAAVRSSVIEVRLRML